MRFDSKSQKDNETESSIKVPTYRINCLNGYLGHIVKKLTHQQPTEMAARMQFTKDKNPFEIVKTSTEGGKY